MKSRSNLGSSGGDTGNEGPTRDPEGYYLVHSDLGYYIVDIVGLSIFICLAFMKM